MKESSKKFAADTAKDIIISVVIVAVIFLSLYAYTQNWPPLVVIESESMQHGSISHIGTADTGDIVLVKKVYSEDDVVTYVEGRMKNYHTYGDYGNVIIYNYNGQSIIHRAIMYLKWEGDHWGIRGWDYKSYTLKLNISNVVVWTKNGSKFMNITIQALEVGKDLNIRLSGVSLSYNTPYNCNAEDIKENMNLVKISLSGGYKKVVSGSEIIIRNLKESYVYDRGINLKINFFDYNTKTKNGVPISSLLSTKVTTELTYPSWLEVTRNEIIIKDVGYAHKSIIIHTDPKDLDPEKVGYEGFITMGDHNLAKYGSYAYDQNSVDFVPICPKLVNYNMIEGVAVGEIPWFGAIKLYVTGTNTNEIPENTKVNLAVSIIGIIALTFIADYLIEHRKSILERFRKRENSEEANDDFKEEKKPPLEDLEK